MAPKPLTSPLAVHAVRLRDESINALSVFDFCIHFSAFQRYEMAPKPLTSPLAVHAVRLRDESMNALSVFDFCIHFSAFQRCEMAPKPLTSPLAAALHAAYEAWGNHAVRSAPFF